MLIISKPDVAIIPLSFSDDGKILAFGDFSIAPPGTDIGIFTMADNSEMKKLLQEEYFEAGPQISPDGRFMAYQSDESGELQIFVCSFPDVTKGKWQVSNDGWNSPLWSPDGRELYFRSGSATMEIEIETEPTFKKRENPKVLFKGNYSFSYNQMGSLTPWDLHPDGKRFLMIKLSATAEAESSEAQAAPTRQPKINIVLNWFEELKERVPVD